MNGIPTTAEIASILSARKQERVLAANHFGVDRYGWLVISDLASTEGNEKKLYEIINDVNIVPARASLAIPSLVNRQYVLTKSLSYDRRVSLLSLTKKGMAVFQFVTNAVEWPEGEVVSAVKRIESVITKRKLLTLSEFRVLLAINEEGYMCVTDLEERLDFSQSTMSVRVLKLKEKGLLNQARNARSDSKNKYYSLSESAEELLAKYLNEYR